MSDRDLLRAASANWNARALKLKDARFTNFFQDVAGRWNYTDFVGTTAPKWRDGWISFDCVLADDDRDVIWCGLTNFAGDIFYKFDRSQGVFTSMNFAAIGDRHDAKFHRSLTRGPAGELWAATALLHDVDRYMQAPGGALVRIDPATERIEIVARPFPHVYIQSITIDQERGLLYGQTFTPEFLFVFDLETHKTTCLGAIGSGIAMGQSETLRIDRRGTLWGTWSVTRAWLTSPGQDQFRLWRYHPDQGQIEFLDYGLPAIGNDDGYAHGDGVHTGPDGAVYMGTAQGVLCRIDPDTHTVQALGKPGPHQRLAGMANGVDAKLYGTAGRDGDSILFRYDPDNEALEDLGSIYDATTQQRPYQIHDLTCTADGTLYAGENDNPYRSGYLWELRGAVNTD